MNLKEKINTAVNLVLPENTWLVHTHLCDFTMCGYSKRKQKKMCKEYLASIGQKRDRDLACCDECKHMKFVVCDSDDYNDLVGIISPIE